MAAFKITFRCKAGHTSTLTLSNYTREMAEDFAGLMDGSSPLYVIPPGPESMLGKCCYTYRDELCGEPFKCMLEEVPDAN